MKFLQGERVRHPSMMEWGIGQVLEDTFGENVHIFFVGAGEKVLKLSFVNLIRIQGDEAAHPVLDNPKLLNKSKVNKKNAVKYRSFSQLTERFRTVFPEGFYGDGYLKKERNYKVDAHNLMVNLLDQKSYDSLIASHDYHEICKRALQVVNKTNLISPHEKISLSSGLSSDQHEQLFGEELRSLLYGEDKLERRFNAFCDCLMDFNAAKWTTSTYFLFMAFPSDYMFLKPIVTQKAAEVCGFELNYRPDLNWLTYSTLLEFSHYLIKELSDLGPRDMIDVQSFIWSTARIEEGEYSKV
jgi:hypothetical protein